MKNYYVFSNDNLALKFPITKALIPYPGAFPIVSAVNKSYFYDRSDGLQTVNITAKMIDSTKTNHELYDLFTERLVEEGTTELTVLNNKYLAVVDYTVYDTSNNILKNAVEIYDADYTDWAGLASVTEDNMASYIAMKEFSFTKELYRKKDLMLNRGMSSSIWGNCQPTEEGSILISRIRIFACKDVITADDNPYYISPTLTSRNLYPETPTLASVEENCILLATLTDFEPVVLNDIRVCMLAFSLVIAPFVMAATDDEIDQIIYDNNHPIPPVPEEDITLTGNDFNVTYENSGTLTEDIVKLMANIIATEIPSGEDLTDDVTVDRDELDAIINGSEEGGTYDLTFTVMNTIVRKSLIVTCTVAEKVPEPTYDVRLTADDFTIEYSKAATLDATEAKRLSNVSAIALPMDTDITDRVIVDTEDLAKIVAVNPIGGKFELSFTVTDDHSNTRTIVIYVTVTPQEPDVILTADDFTVAYADASALTEASVKTLANVSATATPEGTDITDKITVDSLQLEALQAATAIGGSFYLKFSVTEDTITKEEIITVIVTPEASAITITANNFTVAYEDLSLLDADKVKQMSSVNAILTPAGTSLVDLVTVDIDELNTVKSATESGGEFTVELSVTNEELTKGVIITVTVSPKIVPDVTLTAEDFNLLYTDAITLTLANAKTLASVSAIATPSGTNLFDDVTAPDAEIDAIKAATAIGGSFTITFTITHDGITKTDTVNVTVAAEGETISGDTPVAPILMDTPDGLYAGVTVAEVTPTSVVRTPVRRTRVKKTPIK